MTIDEAKLILQGYRAGGEDDHDPIFAEALQLTRTDQGLARWFNDQQAFETAMREALQSQLPPAGLRDAITMAKTTPLSTSRSPSNVFRYLAVAAAVVLLAGGVIFVGQEMNPSMTVASFARTALDIKEQNRIVLGKENTDPAKLRTWLAERGAPHEFVIPPGLQGVPSIGCQSYLVNGKKVALICFNLGNNQVAHLFVVEKSALADASSDSRPQVRSEHGLAFATWTAGGKSFVLTGDNVTEETLRRLI